MLDRIDAGFSLFLHIPGFLPGQMPIMVDNLTIDVYLPLHQLQQHGQVFERSLTHITQIFAESIALPHLKHTQDYRSLLGLPLLVLEATHACAMSASTATQLTEQLIPSPVNSSSAHFQF